MNTNLNKLLARFRLNTQINDLNDSYVRSIIFKPQIPKIIHQTFYTKNLPAELKKNIDNIKSQNPDWAHNLYDDTDIENYIKLNFPELLKFYLLINPIYGAAKADFFRYLVIYKEGGVYLDIKSGVSKPLNEIIKQNDSLLLSHWTQYDPSIKLGFYKGINNPNGEIQQWHILSASGHPIIKKVIDSVCSNIKKYNPLLHGTGKLGVLRLTGPIAYTEAITPLTSIYPCRVELSHEEAGLIYNVLDSHDTHHKVFGKQHYTMIKSSIVKQSTLMNTLLNVFNFIKKVSKLVIVFLHKLRWYKQNKAH